jgi:hypothetical protein
VAAPMNPAKGTMAIAAKMNVAIGFQCNISENMANGKASNKMLIGLLRINAYIFFTNYIQLLIIFFDE